MFMYIVALNELYPIFLASGKDWSYEARARGIFHMYNVSSLINPLSLLSGQMLTLMML